MARPSPSDAGHAMLPGDMGLCALLPPLSRHGISSCLPHGRSRSQQPEQAYVDALKPDGRRPSRSAGSARACCAQQCLIQLAACMQAEDGAKLHARVPMTSPPLRRHEDSLRLPRARRKLLSCENGNFQSGCFGLHCPTSESTPDRTWLVPANWEHEARLLRSTLPLGASHRISDASCSSQQQ